MRILYCTRSDSPHDHRFLKALAETGNEIYALRLIKSGKKPNTPAGVNEVEWNNCDGKCNLIEIFRKLPHFKKAIDQIKPDVVHAGPVQDVAFLAALTGVHPLLTMSWGFDMMRDAYKSRLQKWITAYTLKRSDWFAADCKAVIHKAREFRYSSDKVVLFPWGVDLDHFSIENGFDQARKIRKELSWEDKFVVLGLRSWEPQYGMDILAKAFVIASKQELRLRLLILGDGSQAHKITSILKEGACLDRVHFGGRVTLQELPGFYCAADVYVSPAHVDGSSVSLLEAMACQRASIVSDIPGNCEWIEQGAHGWIFKDNDIEGLANLIIESSKASNLNALGYEARKMIERDANWEVNFQKLPAAYKMMLGDYHASK